VLVAVGNAPADLSPVFPPDSIRSEQELVLTEQARADSLAHLERLLGAYMARDSAALAAEGSARSDSRPRLGTRTPVREPARAPATRAPAAAPPPARPAPAIRAPEIRPSVQPSPTGEAAEPEPRAPEPQSPEPQAPPVLSGPPRVRPADTTGVRQLPVPTDTIRLPAEPTPGPADTTGR